jgi:hypothetical protein
MRERGLALPHLFSGEKPLPKRGANRKPSRDRRQWAAVVQKATPKIVESLIVAAESLGECAPTLPASRANGGAEEVEDESLAALLLRFLRTPETGGNSGTEEAGNTAVTFDSVNPSVG